MLEEPELGLVRQPREPHTAPAELAEVSVEAGRVTLPVEVRTEAEAEAEPEVEVDTEKAGDAKTSESESETEGLRERGQVPKDVDRALALCRLGVEPDSDISGDSARMRSSSTPSLICRISVIVRSR